MMLERCVKENLFVVIYPYKFTDFLYELSELGEFKHFCDVLVLDISMIVTPGFSKKICAPRSSREGVVVVASLVDFVRHVRELRRRSAGTNICILNEVPAFSSFMEFICSLIIIGYLRGTKAAVLDLFNGGFPMFFPNGVSGGAGSVENLGFFARIDRFFKRNSSFREVVKKGEQLLFGFLSRRLPSATTHRLVAGEDWVKIAKQNERKDDRITIVPGHAQDYSNHLLLQIKKLGAAHSQERTGVLLDGPSPMFTDDSPNMGRKVYCTVDVWYPTLTRFLDWLEENAGVRMFIAGHYKSAHPPVAPCFGNRPVYYGKTRDLLRNSDFVITRGSSAISYAVMFRKPVILFYSNQLKEDRLAMFDMQGMGAMLGVDPINIDDLPSDITPFLKVNEERYRNYEKVCLTSTNSLRPNVQIILEDIMHINTGSRFAPVNVLS